MCVLAYVYMHVCVCVHACVNMHAHTTICLYSSAHVEYMSESPYNADAGACIYIVSLVFMSVFVRQEFQLPSGSHLSTARSLTLMIGLCLYVRVGVV